MNDLVSPLLAALLTILLCAACDRNLEAYDPDEEPRPPDLSRIFPAGAERAKRSDAAARAPESPPTPARGAPPVAASGEPIRGTIRVAPELRERIPSAATLFVIARHGAGGPPLAVKRIASPEFPLEFEIGPDDRMMQQMPFVGPIALTARLDSDGNAMSRSPGDLQGAAAAPSEPGARGVSITLDEIVEP
jgi:cytochrome c-type biogenesis protein CcmH